MHRLVNQSVILGETLLSQWKAGKAEEGSQCVVPTDQVLET